MRKRTNNLPSFFNYKEEGTDNGYESLQDFFISWTIRCSVENLKSENPNLQYYSKKILFALIYSNLEDNKLIIEDSLFNTFEVLNVNTKRQIGLIDLVADVEFIYNGNIERCVLNIENKWYSNIRNQQLEKSANFIRQNYKCKIVDIVLFCDDVKISNQVISHCKEIGYKYLTVPDLQEYSGITFENPSKNDLFDEYWLNF
jgi:hypothetical protein